MALEARIPAGRCDHRNVMMCGRFEVAGSGVGSSSVQLNGERTTTTDGRCHLARAGVIYTGVRMLENLSQSPKKSQKVSRIDVPSASDASATSLFGIGRSIQQTMQTRDRRKTWDWRREVHGASGTSVFTTFFCPSSRVAGGRGARWRTGCRACYCVMVFSRSREVCHV
jgi:hypothetical protein